MLSNVYRIYENVCVFTSSHVTHAHVSRDKYIKGLLGRKKYRFKERGSEKGRERERERERKRKRKRKRECV